jgi:hypothetical protein
MFVLDYLNLEQRNCRSLHDKRLPHFPKQGEDTGTNQGKASSASTSYL